MQISIKGLLLVSVIVFISKLLSFYLYIGPIIISILLGLLINYLYPLNNSFKPGIDFSEKYLLSIAIALMGASLDVSVINLIEPKIFYILIITILVAISSSLILGKIFNLSNSLTFLIGAGNGICGSSAIAGASSILKSKSEDVTSSIAIINLLSLIGIFIIPLFANYFFQENLEKTGILIGATIQSIGHVTASGFMLNEQIGETAVIIKMIRILMLGPVLICLTLFLLFYNYRESNKQIFPIPYFVIGFLFFFVATNYNILSDFLINIIKIISNLSLLCAMTAIGLNTSIKSLKKNGPKIFVLGAISFTLQIATAIYFLL